MNTQFQPAHAPHSAPPKGLLKGLTSFLTRRDATRNKTEQWNQWVFLRTHGFEVHIAGPGVPSDPQALETWQPQSEEISTLEFRPCAHESDRTHPNSDDSARLAQGMTVLLDKLGPILASDQIRWVPGLDQPESSPINELLAKRFVAEKVIRNYDLAERLFRQALDLEPENPDLLGTFALFLHEVRHDPDQAETLYQHALRIHPDHGVNLDNFAIFLHEVRKDHDAAETHYRRALELEPECATHLGNYALFLHEVRGDDDQAETLYRRAIATGNGDHDAILLSNFALYLHDTRRDDDLAEDLYQRAVTLDDRDANCLGNYALFLKNVRQDHDAAEKRFLQALEVDPNHSAHLGNYALFLKNVRRDPDKAEDYYHRALKADPTDPNNLGNLALFMNDLRHNHAAAEDLYRRSLQMEPNNASRLANFVQLLLCQGRSTEGLPLLDRAITLQGATNPVLALELWFYVLAHDPKRFDAALGRVKSLIRTGTRSPGWDLRCNCQRAIQDRHPESALLTALADVISGGHSPEILERFPVWNQTAAA
ncbi:MAG: tetratricopeptide repeat protein [Magnetococcales bacterium]|nr:tetratricopeptide repeat protein [Magnetococcales bacterium]